MVEVFAGVGLPVEQIAAFLINPETNSPISPVTVRKHFRFELDRGASGATARVAGALFKNAMSGNVAAQIWWLKTKGRQTAMWPREKEPPAAPKPPEQRALEANYDGARRLLFAIRKAQEEKKRQKALPNTP